MRHSGAVLQVLHAGRRRPGRCSSGWGWGWVLGQGGYRLLLRHALRRPRAALRKPRVGEAVGPRADRRRLRVVRRLRSGVSSCHALAICLVDCPAELSQQRRCETGPSCNARQVSRSRRRRHDPTTRFFPLPNGLTTTLGTGAFRCAKSSGNARVAGGWSRRCGGVVRAR